MFGPSISSTVEVFHPVTKLTPSPASAAKATIPLTAIDVQSSSQQLDVDVTTTSRRKRSAAEITPSSSSPKPREVSSEDSQRLSKRNNFCGMVFHGARWFKPLQVHASHRDPTGNLPKRSVQRGRRYGLDSGTKVMLRHTQDCHKARYTELLQNSLYSYAVKADRLLLKVKTCCTEVLSDIVSALCSSVFYTVQYS